MLIDKAPDKTDSFRCSPKSLENPVYLPLTSGLEEGPEAVTGQGQSQYRKQGALSVKNVKTIIKPTHSLLFVITVGWQSYTLSVMRTCLPEKIFCSSSSKKLL